MTSNEGKVALDDRSGSAEGDRRYRTTVADPPIVTSFWIESGTAAGAALCRTAAAALSLVPEAVPRTRSPIDDPALHPQSFGDYVDRAIAETVYSALEDRVPDMTAGRRVVSRARDHQNVRGQPRSSARPRLESAAAGSVRAAVLARGPPSPSTADAGGSNGHRPRVRKAELERLADKLGLAIHVSHFPPGTSKWNKIEHRMFSFISINWRGRPLRTLPSSRTW